MELAALAEGFPPRAGALGLLSGDEFRPEVAGFDRALLEAAGPRVGLVICADHEHRETTAANARAHLARLGANVVDGDLIHGGKNDEVDLVYLPGGSPAELLSCLRGNEAWTRIEGAWKEGVALGGSSAGAMALCRHCLVPRPGDRVPTRWSEGLGPIESAALAVHASSRPGGWLAAVAARAPVPVLALDDHTGLLLHAGQATVIGPGCVRFVT